jgi:hypothetical protein
VGHGDMQFRTPAHTRIANGLHEFLRHPLSALCQVNSWLL